jgi:Trypsin-like peptidase domain
MVPGRMASPLGQFAEPGIRSLAVLARANGNVIANATAFVVIHQGEYYLVTNWHVATGRHPETGCAMSKMAAVPEELAVLHHVAGEPGSWEYKCQSLYDEDDDPLWLEHPTHGRRVDVVAVPLTQTDGIQIFPYDPTRPGPVIVFGPSNAVSVIGFPFGQSGGGGLGIWVQGTIATEPSIDYEDEEHGGVPLPCLLVDSRTREGQSGSPVILYRTDGYTTEDGSMINNGVPAERFIGVYSGRINKNSDLGFVWKARALVEILSAQHRGQRP